MKKLILAIVCLMTLSSMYAQDKFLRLSGKTVNCVKIWGVDKEYIYYNNSQNHVHRMDLTDIFMITKDGKDSIIYKIDPALGYDLSVDQMKVYIKGEVDANQFYKRKTALVGGFVYGGVGGLIGFWGVSIPAIYALTINLGSPKMKGADPVYKDDPNYINGYRGKAKSKRLKKAIISGSVGFAVFSLLKVFL